MSLHAWAVFAAFWAVFVISPGPNAVNCIANGMAFGFRRSLWGVLAILTQAALFLTLSAMGVAALLAAAGGAQAWLRFAGAAVLVGLGLRTMLTAARPLRPATGGSIYGRAFLIATLNVKSLAGYLAAFTQFVQPGVPVWSQMGAIFPTALSITALSYCGYTAIGAGMGRAAQGAAAGRWFRRVMGAVFVAFGCALGLSGQLPWRM